MTELRDYKPVNQDNSHDDDEFPFDLENTPNISRQNNSSLQTPQDYALKIHTEFKFYSTVLKFSLLAACLMQLYLSFIFLMHDIFGRDIIKLEDILGQLGLLTSMSVIIALLKTGIDGFNEKNYLKTHKFYTFNNYMILLFLLNLMFATYFYAVENKMVPGSVIVYLFGGFLSVLYCKYKLSQLDPLLFDMDQLIKSTK